MHAAGKSNQQISGDKLIIISKDAVGTQPAGPDTHNGMAVQAVEGQPPPLAGPVVQKGVAILPEGPSAVSLVTVVEKVWMEQWCGFSCKAFLLHVTACF